MDMNNVQRRYVRLRRRENGISGVLLQYGDTARLPGGYSETIARGAFDGFDKAVFRLNLMHDRSQIIAFADSEYLNIEDSPDGTELRLDLTYPDTVHGRNARELVDAGALRGLSVEYLFGDGQDAVTWDNKHLTVHRGKLLGAGIVDIPAYPNSTLNRAMLPTLYTGTLPILNERRVKGKMGGLVAYNNISVVSTAQRTAVRFLPGAFTESPAVSLLHGANYDNILSSTSNKSLELRLLDEGLQWAAKKLVKTSGAKDVVKLFNARLLSGFNLGYVAEPGDIEQEQIEMMGLEFTLDNVSKAMPCEVRLVSTAVPHGTFRKRYAGIY